VGLVISPLDLRSTLGPQLIYPLGWLDFFLSLFLFNSYLLKDNPRLKKALMWTFRSYRQSVMGLDEREKLVIAQAFRTSHQILALVCSLLVVGLFFSTWAFHLTYRLNDIGSYCIALGVGSLLLTLPATLVAWHECVCASLSVPCTSLNSTL
jgi:hypothetical protein